MCGIIGYCSAPHGFKLGLLLEPFVSDVLTLLYGSDYHFIHLEVVLFGDAGNEVIGFGEGLVAEEGNDEIIEGSLDSFQLSLLSLESALLQSQNLGFHGNNVSKVLKLIQIYGDKVSCCCCAFPCECFFRSLLHLHFINKIYSNITHLMT